ncbi:MAG: RNHCP domain-containing protein [Oscillospiraceae bacterium]|nr:RNHCP domain-containing protein [Oscillospiraceae bacterium]
MKLSRFTEIDEPFVCLVCGAEVAPLGYTSRDHCNRCLCSLHVDVNPGDRQATCGGVLRPVGVENAKKGVKILYKCERCGMRRKNIAAKDDDGEMILGLWGLPVEGY